MRITLNSVAAIAFSIAACVACSKRTETATSATPPAPAGETFTAVGCPEPGPAPGCLVIKAKGKAYDLAGANPPVDKSKGVAVSVVARAGPDSTACGVRLSSVKVDYLGIQCAPPAPPAESAP